MHNYNYPRAWVHKNNAVNDIAKLSVNGITK